MSFRFLPIARTATALLLLLFGSFVMPDQRLPKPDRGIIISDPVDPGDCFLTPGHGNDPSMKIIRYNTGNFEWENFTTLFYPYEKLPLSQSEMSWGNDSFDFRKLTGDTGDSPLRDWVPALDSSRLQKAIRLIYKAGNGPGDAKEVDRSIPVYAQ